MKKKPPVKKSSLKKATRKRKVPAASRKLSVGHSDTFPIVGLGGSAGSFDAFEKFLSHLPPNTGMAFVLIMHLDPNHKGQLSQLLQKFTSLLVTEATDGLRVMPDRLYIIPPNKDMALHNSRLLLLNQEKKRGIRMPIDYFFQSLAEDQGRNAAAIVFSGMGSDGETGVRMVKERLGLVMVQDPRTCSFGSMPESAIGTNLVDYILPPEEMPLKLIQYMRHPILSEEPPGRAGHQSKNANAVQKIIMMLRSQTGHDFTQYKKSTVVRRIERRIAYHQLADFQAYVNFLRENPQELNVLFNELLIGVTKFFRDAEAFEVLGPRLKEMLKRKSNKEPFRIWVAGCSTGEEAYTLAILVSEYLDTTKESKLPRVQIFATDIDAEAIENARQGTYLGNIVADVGQERLNKYFIKTNDTYTVKKELREMIVFAQHNLIKDAPFTRLDLLSCRNLLIYLDVDLQKRLMPVLHYSLNSDGLLMLGPAETIGGFTNMFQPADAKWKIFTRKSGPSAIGQMLDFPFHISEQGKRKEILAKAGKSTSLQELYQRVLLDNFTPASVLINEKGDILYVNGKMNSYLEVTSGEAVMNIHRLARSELKYGLSNAIHQAHRNKVEITIRNIRLKESNMIRLVTLRVKSIEDMGPSDVVLVVFEDGGLVEKRRSTTKSQAPASYVEDIEKELILTKEQLQSTVEQMETSMEELKSTNEELQSTNEELQSINEESLTTKEEMQSLNEELMTINIQYQAKAEELTHLNNDMKNLLDSTEIGTVFLDLNMKIVRFTPQVTKLFNLIQSDIGRSITHIVSNFQQASLESEISQVIEKLQTKELEVKTRNDEWYSVRIMPYRSTDNYINGAVLTFQRITALKLLEERLNLLRNTSAILLDMVKTPAVMLDQDDNIVLSNQAFIHHFQLGEVLLQNHSFIHIVEKKIKLPGIVKMLREVHKAKAGIKIMNKVMRNVGGYQVSATRILSEKEAGNAVYLVLFEQANSKRKKVA
jgi:two-component system, chemotaxis family, CheB/CheR fusion protein